MNNSKNFLENLMSLFSKININFNSDPDVGQSFNIKVEDKQTGVSGNIDVKSLNNVSEPKINISIGKSEK